MPSISMRTTSPGLSSTGGFSAMPTPAGVPVEITSPGSRVNAVESVSTCAEQSKIMSSVVAVLAQLAVHPACAARGRAGRRSSSAVTIHGPIGPWVSKDLPIVIVGAFDLPVAHASRR